VRQDHANLSSIASTSHRFTVAKLSLDHRYISAKRWRASARRPFPARLPTGADYIYALFKADFAPLSQTSLHYYELDASWSHSAVLHSTPYRIYRCWYVRPARPQYTRVRMPPS
jgi:hypothetical protein